MNGTMKHILSKQLRLVGKKVGEVRDILLLKVETEEEIYVAVDIEKRKVSELSEDMEVWNELIKRTDLVRFNLVMLGPQGGEYVINTAIKVGRKQVKQVAIELDKSYTLLIPGIS